MPPARPAPNLPSGKWGRKKIDWDAVEWNLEQGDDPELLMTEDEVLIAEMERRRAMIPAKPVGVPLDDDDELDWAKHTQAAVGPTMVFATLKRYKPVGSSGGSAASSNSHGRGTGTASTVEWSEKDIDALTWEWRELLKTAGIETTVYNLGPEERSGDPDDGPKLLITLQQGWRGFEAKDFLLNKQGSVVRWVEWDGVRYEGVGGGNNNNKKKKKRQKDKRQTKTKENQKTRTAAQAGTAEKGRTKARPTRPPGTKAGNKAPKKEAHQSGTKRAESPRTNQKGEMKKPAVGGNAAAGDKAALLAKVKAAVSNAKAKAKAEGEARKGGKEPAMPPQSSETMTVDIDERGRIVLPASSSPSGEDEE